MTNSFSDAVKKRRSIYDLDKNIKVPEQKIVDMVSDAVKHTPTSFNSQTGRVIILFEQDHDKLWDITKEELRKVVPVEKFQPTEDKIQSFKNAYGTILFYEEQDTIKKLQGKFSLYADNFPVWSEQSSGILQFIVWTSLANKGIGASLQHYNPLIDVEVKKQWGVPDTWKLRAQMPFGNPVSPAGDKDIKPIEERLKVYR